jgi:hypothetical protein
MDFFRPPAALVLHPGAPRLVCILLREARVLHTVSKFVFLFVSDMSDTNTLGIVLARMSARRVLQLGGDHCTKRPANTRVDWENHRASSWGLSGRSRRRASR